MTFCCLSYTVYGILMGQPNLADTVAETKLQGRGLSSPLGPCEGSPVLRMAEQQERRNLDPSQS